MDNLLILLLLRFKNIILKSMKYLKLYDFDRDKTQKITFDNNESGWQKLNQELKKQ